MCGCFTQKYTWEELHRLYRLTQPARNIQPRYNICPTDPIDVIIPGNGGLLAVLAAHSAGFLLDCPCVDRRARGQCLVGDGRCHDTCNQGFGIGACDVGGTELGPTGQYLPADQIIGLTPAPERASGKEKPLLHLDKSA
jgi:hypothetical protein